jgi:hypothetical protein
MEAAEFYEQADDTVHQERWFQIVSALSTTTPASSALGEAAAKPDPVKVEEVAGATMDFKICSEQYLKTLDQSLLQVADC